jgi:hypothetical protein
VRIEHGIEFCVALLPLRGPLNLYQFVVRRKGWCPALVHRENTYKALIYQGKPYNRPDHEATYTISAG